MVVVVWSRSLVDADADANADAECRCWVEVLY